jgi:hypothetical protein
MFWLKVLELLPVACFALGAALFFAASLLTTPAFILKLSSAPTTLVGAHEKNARTKKI